MIFTHPRTNAYVYQNNPTNIPMIFSNTNMAKRYTTPTVQTQVTPKPQPKLRDLTNPPVNPDIAPPKKKSMKWGEPTWFLFHTLAEKVKDEAFPYIRTELLTIISTICKNLPCPDCAGHATEYINGINFNNIQTKEQLKDMLYVFHNVVNQRKMFPLFPREQLESKYSQANTIAIIQNFMVHFQDKHASIRMIANDFHRNNIADQMKKWFNENIQYFNY